MNSSAYDASSIEDSEQSRLTKNFEKLEISIDNNESNPVWIDAESPFQWQASRFEEVNSEEVVEIANHKAEFEYNSFDKFARIVPLVYEYVNNGNTKSAQEAIFTLEELLEQDDITNNPELNLAMTHVFYAIKAHFLSLVGNKKLTSEEVAQTIKLMVPMRELPKNAQAAVYALKTKFFSLYRKKGFQQAVESARKARELNPDEPKWMFLLAESLRRESKYFPSSELPREELELLEAAVEKDRNPQYLVHLALRCITCVNQSCKAHGGEPDFHTSKLYHVVQKMEAEAVNMIKEALRMEPDDEIINRRCGFGLMKTRAQKRKENKELIKQTLDRALELAPDSSMTLHYLGKYYHQFGNDNEKALECFNKAIGSEGNNNYPAYCDLIRLKFDMYKSNYNPIPDFEKMLKRQTELDPHFRHEALIIIGSYYLFIKQDLEKAFEYFEKVIDENGDPNRFMTRLIFLQKSDVVDLLGILLFKLNATTEDLPNKEKIINKLRSFSPNHFVQNTEMKIKHTLADIEKKLETQKLCSRTVRIWKKYDFEKSLKTEIQNKGSVSKVGSIKSTNWRSRNLPVGENLLGSKLSWRSEQKVNEYFSSNWRVNNGPESPGKSSWKTNYSRNSLRGRQRGGGYRDEGNQRRSNDDSSKRSIWRELKKIEQ